MSSPLLPNQYHVLALFVATATWGIMLVTFILCVRALIWDRNAMRPFREVNKLMLSVTVAMLVFSSGSVALRLLRVMQITGPTGESDAKFGSAGEIFRYITVCFQTLIGDALLLYRCWAVYERSWIVLIGGGAIWLAATGSALAIIIFVGTLPGELTVPPPEIFQSLLTFWTTSIGLNVIMTGAIAYRLIRSQKQLPHYSSQSVSLGYRPSSRLLKAARIIIESGAIYTAVAVATLGTVASGSVGVYLTSGIEPQVVGIVFNLIIIRVHEAKTMDTMGNTAMMKGWQAQSIPIQIHPDQSMGTSQSGTTHDDASMKQAKRYDSRSRPVDYEMGVMDSR